MSTYIGTFIYTVDVSALTVTPSPSDILTTYYPIVNTGGSFTVLTPTVVPLTTDTFYTVTVPFTYIDSNNSSDGLNFYSNITDNDARNAVYTITHFAGIPLSRIGSQFTRITNLSFSYADVSVPTILSSTSMANSFQYTNFNSSLNTWTDTSNVVNMSGMFDSVSTFNRPLDNWNTINVTSMTNTFYFASVFDQSLNTWNTSNVTNMNGMFRNALAFNQPLNDWNTSNVLDMATMFLSATAFNQPLDNWNTSNVVNMSGMFASASAFDGSLNGWNTSNVTNMNGMFNGATAFNQPLNTWNTSNVTNMGPMFANMNVFNQQISYDPTFNYWNTSNVTNMEYMFDNALLFNNGGGIGDTTRPMNWIANTTLRGTFVIYNGALMPPGFLNNSRLTYQGDTYNSPFPIVEPPPPPVICFLEGTKLLCYINNTEVYVPIQHISRGTLVKTLLSGYKPVELIGFSKLYNPGNKLHSKNRLYKCSPEQYPELTEDLIITGCHSILVDELTDIERERTIAYLERIFVTDRKYRLIACLDEKAEPYTEEGIHTIWHLALENDSYYMNYGIFANGLLVETTSLRMMKELSGMELVE